MAGGGLGLWAVRTMGRQMTISIRLLEGHRLVQEGPYSVIRHPTYTAVLLFTLGLGLAFLDVPILLLWVLVVLLARYRARLEEDFLRSPEAFGEAYTSYTARTGRFLPKVRRSGT